MNAQVLYEDDVDDADADADDDQAAAADDADDQPGGGNGGGRGAGDGSTPEQVLLQIVLALVPLLGVALYMQAELSGELGGRLEGIERQWGDLPEDVKHGVEREARAGIAQQRAELLLAWERQRQAVPLFRRVAEFRISDVGNPVGGVAGRGAESVASTLAPRDALAHANFKQLVAESERLFGTERATTAAGAAAARRLRLQQEHWVAECLREARLTPPPRRTAVSIEVARELEPLRALGEAARAESRVADPANVDFLAEHIANDVSEQRRLIGDIQGHLFERLVTDSQSTYTESDAGRLWAEVLRRFEPELKFLPEIREQFNSNLGGGGESGKS